ncbi:jg22085 [Pararge aegeria aegeria]|uniref:Jg22085 protein n=1 Tax=Pararge aegeria aegeria TaxID=348720 RepID=A0A8S4RMX1_9NEOP|nr:jg22085 [Pararge aegeria aegeria]
MDRREEEDSNSDLQVLEWRLSAGVVLLDPDKVDRRHQTSRRESIQAVKNRSEWKSLQKSYIHQWISLCDDYEKVK